jgi:hypothetical protein
MDGHSKSPFFRPAPNRFALVFNDKIYFLTAPKSKTPVCTALITNQQPEGNLL